MIPAMAAKAAPHGDIGTFRPLPWEDVAEICRVSL